MLRVLEFGVSGGVDLESVAPCLSVVFVAGNSCGETLRTPDPCIIMCRGRQGGFCCLDLSH